MDYSRRETLALGGGVAGGLLTGGLIGVGARRLDADGAVGGDGDEPMQLIVGTRDDESVEMACDAVDYVEPDRSVTAADAALATPAVQPVATPWGVDRIRAPAAHEAGYRGADARVAVVDSGVSPHPDLRPNLGDDTALVDCEGKCEAV